MKTKRIITATLLSAGLILGTTSAAHAVDPTPTATMATYSPQLAAYNTSLVAYDSATATIKIRIASYAAAIQVYKTSYATAVQTYQALVAGHSPAKNATDTAILTAAYKSAVTSYYALTATFSAQKKIYQAVAHAYLISYLSTAKDFKTVLAAHDQLSASIDVVFYTVVHIARTNYLAAMAGARTASQKASAVSTRAIAVAAATGIRNAALAALGSTPVKPIKPSHVIVPDNGYRAERPIKATN